MTDRAGMNGSRVAVVTGATRGIGLEIASQLAARGLWAVIGGRDADRARTVAEELAERGAQASHVQLDVTDPRSVTAAIERVLEDLGRVDVLVNNAGIAIDGPEHRASAPDIDRVRATLETNLIGAWRCCAAVVPAMQEAGYGRIVNISSSAASLVVRPVARGYGPADARPGTTRPEQTTSPSSPAYRISKIGLNMLTAVLAAELAGTGVLVNAASPGRTRTDMSPDAERPVEAGADTPVWLATLPDDGPTGGFFYEREPMSW